MDAVTGMDQDYFIDDLSNLVCLKVADHMKLRVLRDLRAFSVISCTLFSPKSRSPASYASINMETGFVLLTEIRVTSFGSLPARRQAAFRRSLTFLYSLRLT